MRVALTFLVLFFIIGCRSYPPLTCKLPSNVITLEKSKQQILNDTETFIALTFVSAKAVIEISNDNVIVGKGVFAPYKDVNWEYSFVVRAKDGKVSYHFENIILNDLNNYDTKSEFLHKKLWDAKRQLVCQSLTDLAANYEEYIKKDHDDF